MNNKRERKTTDQKKHLLEEFKKNPNKWTIQECVEIGDSINMDRA